jgi:3-oxoacyl-[acyl-carrier-protein] synthase-3
MAESSIGIVGAAVSLPAEVRTVADVFRDEGIAFRTEMQARLGIDHVHVSEGETGSELAAIAAREALQRAGIKASEIGVIVDYSILPQEWLVPVWNMSNKLQHVLGATDAFTAGFSCGGATKFLTSIHFASGMLRNQASFKAILLVRAEIAIAGHRVVNPDDPVSVLGDGTSADRYEPQLGLRSCRYGALVGRKPTRRLLHSDRLDLCRVVLDKLQYDTVLRTSILRRRSPGTCMVRTSLMTSSLRSTHRRTEARRLFHNGFPWQGLSRGCFALALRD